MTAPLAAPAVARAHGIVQREDLPVPHVVFAWAVAGVLVVSFVALAALWPRPRLERPPWRPLPGGRLLGGRAWDLLGGTLGVALLLVVLAAGWTGGGTALDNLAPTFILITFWVGLAFASVVLGDVFALVSPWRALGRATGRVVRAATGREPRHVRYPERLGRYPAAAVILAFAWIELVSGWGDAPGTLAAAALGYTVLTLLAQAAFGVEAWTGRGEGFAVWFGLLARLSVWERREGVLGVRPPLGGLPRVDPVPGTVALLVTAIGTVSFDGLSRGSAWSSARGALVDALTALGVSPQAAPPIAATLGLLAAVAAIGGFYALGVAGARTAGDRLGAAGLRRAFAHTLVPIAAAYVAAHYFTFLLFEGQGIAYLASDPFGQGWDLFGTASVGIDYGLLGPTEAWYVQVGLVCLGHVAGVVLAHDRALALHDGVRPATRSQYWLLAVMIGFTSLALWLLAQSG